MSSSHAIFNGGGRPAAPANLPSSWVPKRPGGPQTLPRFFTYPPMKAKWSYTRIQWPWKEPALKPSVSPANSTVPRPARQRRDKSPKLAPKRRQPARRSARIEHEQLEKEARSKKERVDAKATATETSASQRQKKGQPASGISKARAKKACLKRPRGYAKGAMNPLQRGEFGKVLGPEGGDYMQHQKKLTLQARAVLMDFGELGMEYDDDTDIGEDCHRL